jgi:hypothetical protein
MIELSTGWSEFILAFVLFFARHVVPSRPMVRKWLVRHVGKMIYIWAYSVLSIFSFRLANRSGWPRPLPGGVAIFSLENLGSEYRDANCLFASRIRHCCI